MKLELLANNMGMANVCSVPLSYIFLRGQGVKIFRYAKRSPAPPRAPFRVPGHGLRCVCAQA